MAFTKTPGQDTYSTKEVKLMNVWESRNRSADKDNEALNLFYEFVSDQKTKDSDFFVVKRDGTTLRAYYVDPTDGVVRNFYHWEDNDAFIVAQGADLQIFRASTGVPLASLLGEFTTTTGEVGFTEYQYDTGVTSVIITDGTTLLELSTTFVATACTDPGLPVPHLPYPQYLDGYVFVIKSGTADIYNSDLNDPLVWTSGSPISAEMLPDTARRLGKLNNYLLVFGSASIEYFWDAGNATGSPLQRYDTPVKYIGYLGAYAELANRIYFVGNSATAAPDVYVLEDLKITEISDPVVRRYLIPLSTFDGNVVSFGGHDFFWLTAGTLTYAYDMDNKLWHRMAWKTGTDFPIRNAHTVFVTGLGNVTVFNVNGDTAFYSFQSGTYTDYNINTSLGVNFTMRIITDPEFFDTYNRKTAGRLIINGDRPPATCTASVSHTDDDYQTWSTARTVDLNSKIPKLERNGQFRRRAWKVEVTSNNPVRLKQIEIDLNIGQS